MEAERRLRGEVKPQEAITKELLYAQYHLGKLSVSDLARELRNWNQIYGEYEIRRSKKSILAATQFRDIPTNKPGEQLSVTLKENTKPTLKEAKAEISEEQDHARKSELKAIITKHRHDQLFQKLNVWVIFIENIRAKAEANKRLLDKLVKTLQQKRIAKSIHNGIAKYLKLQILTKKILRFVLLKFFAKKPRRRFVVLSAKSKV